MVNAYTHTFREVLCIVAQAYGCVGGMANVSAFFMTYHAEEFVAGKPEW